MKTAFVHDWLVTYRGGERCLEALVQGHPGAPIFTLFHKRGSQPPSIECHPIIESPLAAVPGARDRHRYFLPLFPWAIEQFNLNEFDVVISTSSAVARGAVTRADAVHISYVHTPMRYVWDFADDYFAKRALPIRAAASLTLPYLRMWDESTSNRVDVFVANSHNVANRIRKRYRRDSKVVYPPVAVDRFKPTAHQEDFFLIVSALVPYKRVDLAISAFNSTSRRLVIVGDGPEASRLRALAGPHIEFKGALGDQDLAELYAKAQALIFPGEEDFGIAPVEAMAAGRPVIAFARGGATETVIPPGKGAAPTGLWFDRQTPEALLAAVAEFERKPHIFDPVKVSAWAQQFSTPRYIAEMESVIHQATKGPREGHSRGELRRLR